MKKRNIGLEVLEGIREIKSGKAARRTSIDIPAEIKAIREKTKLSQAAFAEMLGISKRTVQEWEQGRCKPTGAALTLLMLVRSHPAIVLGLAHPGRGLRSGGLAVERIGNPAAR